jgi:hypothetical protein
MAIAYVASSTPQNLDASNGTQAVNLPAGHASGHVLLMWTMTDDRLGTTSTPSGWTKLLEVAAGVTNGFLVYNRLKVYWRIDTGSLGASVNVTWSASTWPFGDGSVLVWTSAYSGCDTVAPIETWSATSTTSTAASMSHPQLTTITNNAWLLTFRTAYSGTARTFTASGGTNTERVDTNFDGLHGALYDGGPLASGLQTQRATLASGTCSGGGSAVSIVLKPAPVAGSTSASPGVASATATAFNPTVSISQPGWGLCTSNAPDYQFDIDWNGDGTFTLPGEEVTSDIISDVVVSHGRDQERQLNPSVIGSAAFDLVNVDRAYSPENPSSPLAGNLDPARPAKIEVAWNGLTYPVFRGRLDDFDLKADRSDRSVNFSFLDGLNDLQGVQLSTGVYSSMRTGDLINTVLDLAGWTGGRDIDPGATFVPWWWEDGPTALEAIQKLVRSEGPPSIAYVGPDGTFIFRDRHHRILNQRSQISQASFGAAAVGCASPVVTGYDFTAPFTYSHGMRDIVNVVNFEVAERSPDALLTDVWTSESTVSLGIGQSSTITVSAQDPFRGALTPVQGVDFTKTGAGLVQVTLSRTEGQSATITLLAVGGSVTVTGLKLRAHSIPVRRTTRISQRDSASVTLHGERSYPNDAPWANVHDAFAIANMILLHYATRRPTVQIRVVAQDPAHLSQILQRDISDRIHIRNDEISLDADFFIEKITHTIRRFNQAGKPPVHAVVFGCEKDLTATTNPFTFDLRGAGFDQGVFDPISADRPDNVFIFDDANNGRFDFGLLGT